MKNVKLYNMIFPIWMLVYLPSVWLISLPANFLIDSIVFAAALYILKIDDKKKVYKKNIIKIWLFGFLADFMGAAIMFLGSFAVFDKSMNDVGAALEMNPYREPIAVLWTFLSILLSGICIYFFDRNFALKKSNLDDRQKRVISIIMAVITAPYFMLLPTTLFV